MRQFGAVVVLLLMLIGVTMQAEAATYQYEANQQEEDILSAKAKEDGVTAQEAFSRIVKSALAQIAETLQHQHEQDILSATKRCSETGGILMIDTTGGKLTWQCVNSFDR
jgi:hypothetical protein